MRAAPVNTLNPQRSAMIIEDFIKVPSQSQRCQFPDNVTRPSIDRTDGAPVNYPLTPQEPIFIHANLKWFNFLMILEDKLQLLLLNPSIPYTSNFRPRFPVTVAPTPIVSYYMESLPVTVADIKHCR
ncbi:hypothetical protein Lser_V15G03055 [Lactuca serriola]